MDSSDVRHITPRTGAQQDDTLGIVLVCIGILSTLDNFCVCRKSRATCIPGAAYADDSQLAPKTLDAEIIGNVTISRNGLQKVGLLRTP